MLQRVSYWILAMLPMVAMDVATILCLSLMHFHSIEGMSNQKQSCVRLCPHASQYAEVTHLHCPKYRTKKISTKTTKNHLRDGHAMSSPVAPVAPVAPFQGAQMSPASTILLMYCTCEDRSVSGQVFLGFSTFFTWLNPKTP